MTPPLARVRAALRRFSLVPPPPCGAISPKLGVTLADLRALGFLGPMEHGKRRSKPPRPWHRHCVCALGHDGDYHRSEDGQVWHRDDSVTREALAEEAAEQRRQQDALASVVFTKGTVTETSPETRYGWGSPTVLARDVRL